jgi:hypothetical protein
LTSRCAALLLAVFALLPAPSANYGLMSITRGVRMLEAEQHKER